MKVSTILLIMLMVTPMVHAQERSTAEDSWAVTVPKSAFPAEEEKELPDGWNKTLVAGLNLNQVSLHNWTQGGENTLAWTFLTNGFFAYKQPDWIWKNVLKITYGRTKLGDAEYEKTEDELFWESLHSRDIGWKIDPYVANQLRTQFAPGYKMRKNEETGLDEKVQTSGLWDPGYLIQSAGFTYAEGQMFFTRLGVAFKETFSSEYGYADDPDTDGEIETFRFQTGVESATGLKITVMENVLYTSQLNLFSAFDQLDVWDVRWDNTFSAEVNSYINVSLNVLLVHDISQTYRTQIKQALALGLHVSLL
ncbi:MAG: DUF3078 domain-containing protein [Bacteroidetes bacterium]|nr:DUF3078 domain-containing protein [Bacteroidota bacterium]